VFAAFYDRMMAAADEAGLADRRRRLLAGAGGRVLDVGAGTGLNIAYFGEVDELHLVEPDAGMARRLARRVASAAIPAVIHQTSLLEADLVPGSFDTIVCSLVLCSVDDVAATLARLLELLAPGGQVLFLEHVRTVGLAGRMQDLAVPAWRLIAGGCRPNRDTLDDLRKAGFAITDCDRFRIRKVMPIVASGVAGIAVRRVRPTALTEVEAVS
jgi:SAM-dependent methyltransferase